MHIVKNNISLDSSIVFECFAAMFRVQCHDEMVPNSKGRLVESQDMNKWVLNTQKLLTVQMKQELEVFFHYESYFGLNLISYLLINKKHNTFQEALSFLKETTPLEFVSCFMKSGYNKGEIKNPDDYKEVTEYIKTMNLPQVEQWKLVFLYNDADNTKQRFLSLFEKFYTLFIQNDIDWIKNIHQESIDELKGELETNPISKLESMLLFDTQQINTEHTLIIYPSVFYGTSSFNSSIEEEGLFIFIYGTSMPHLLFQSTAYEDKLISSFKALADDNRIKIIKILCRKKVHGYELAQMLNLSNSTVSHHIGVLAMQGFLKTTRIDNKSYYQVDREVIHNSLESMYSFLTEDN